MKRDQTILDIIIINYNSTDHLLHCLSSIFDTAKGPAIQVLVQDNASKDNPDRVKQLFPQVRLTKNNRNLGFARATNNGLKQGSAPYVVILNPDTIIKEGFFESAMEYMDRHLDVGILGPRILDSDGAIQGSARSFPDLLTALFGRKSILTRVFPDNPITRENILTSRSDGTTPMEVDWVSGACMFVRRKAIEDVGAMDARFFLYWEDADWCRGMWTKGWKVVYFPRASVMHFVGVSSEKNVFRSVLEFHKSIYHLFEKHAERPYLFLKPLVYWGLIYRFLFVIISQSGGRLFRRLKARTTYPAPVQTPQTDGRIKIVRFIARLNIGGPSIHVYLLTKGIDEKRFSSVLVTGEISPQEGDMSYLFDSVGPKPVVIRELQREISPLMDVKAFFRIFKILNREAPHIVHTHTAKAGTIARLAVFLYNAVCGRDVRTIHTFHGHVFEGYFSKRKSSVFVLVERFLAMRTDVIVAISETQRKELSERFRIALPEKIRTIPLGFDLGPFADGHRSKGRFRRSLGLDEDTLLICIVGRLVPIKHHAMFLDVAELFLRENPGIAVRFIVIGDGELREELEAYSRRRGLSGNVMFCGWRRDLSELYADMDILALTSLNEGTPVSIIEAMAASIPVIATDVGGVVDLLGPKDGCPSSDGFVVCKRGVLCVKNDVSGFAGGLAYLAGLGDQEKGDLVANARVFVEEIFSVKRLLKDIELLYLEMMGRAGSAGVGGKGS